MVETINDNNLAEHLASPRPLLLKCGATWCGPCKSMAPVFEATAKDYPYVTFGELDVDESKKTAGQYGVRGVPTTLMIRDGQVVASKVGAMTSGQLAEFVKRNAQ